MTATLIPTQKPNPDAAAEDLLIFKALFLEQQLERAWHWQKDIWRNERSSWFPGETEEDDELPEEWRHTVGQVQWVLNELRTHLEATGIMPSHYNEEKRWRFDPPKTYSDGSPVYVYAGRDYLEESDPVHLERSEKHPWRFLLGPGGYDLNLWEARNNNQRRVNEKESA